MSNSSVDDGQALLKPDDSRESTFPSSSQDDLKVGEEARGHDLESTDVEGNGGYWDGDEFVYSDGVGKEPETPIRYRERGKEVIPSWAQPSPIEFVKSRKGEKFCYYWAHIFKGMILQGCPLQVFVQLNLGHVNTFRKLRDSLKGQVPKESWVNHDLRCRRGRKEVATLEWKLRAFNIILDMKACCKVIGCKAPLAPLECYAIARNFEPWIPIEFVKAPFMDVRDQTAGSASVGEKRPKESRNIDFPRLQGNHERNRIHCLDEYIKEFV